MSKWIKRTTVGRFWAYVGVMLALGVSLAGNVAAAYLRSKDPSWVELCFAGIPPAVAFLAIEIVNHNPWANAPWGGAITKVMLFVVAPGAAIVSFVHLTTVAMAGTVVMPQQMETVLAWVTAILTALLIDGLILGATGALLLPKTRLITEEVKSPASAPTAAAQAIPRPKLVRASLARQVGQQEKDRKRWPPREHPLWNDWLAARESGSPWTASDFVLQIKTRMDRDLTTAAAATLLGRWEKELGSA